MPTPSTSTRLLALALLAACREPNDGKSDNAAPVLDAVTITSDTNRFAVGATLTCAATASDPEGETLTLSFTWDAGGRALGTGELLVLTPGLLAAGEEVICTATATDPAGATATGATGVIFEDTAPTVTNVRIDPEADVTSDTVLTCTAEAADADGSTPTLVYAWRNETTGVDLGTEPTLALTPESASPGDAIACDATASADTTSTTGTARVTVTNRAPVATGVTITPEAPASFEEVRCAVDGVADPDGDAVGVTYRWEVDGVAAGEGDTLPAPFPVGATLTCIVEIDDGREGGLSVLEAEVTVQNTAPEIGTPTLAGAPHTNDSTLTCEAIASDLDGDAPTVTYAWTNATRGTPLGEGASLTLDATLAAPEDEIVCVATATDAQGLTATSTGSTVLVNRAPTLGAVVIDPAAPTADAVLTCAVTSSGDPDQDAVTLAYAWTVNGASAGSDAAPSGTLTRGDAVTCTVTATDAHGGETVGATSVTVEDSAPAVVAVTLAPTAPDTTEDIVAVATTYDLDGDSVSLTYTWTVDGVVVQSGASDTLPAGSATRGQRVEVSVTPDDGTLSGSARAAAVTIGNAAPTIASVTLSPETVRTDDTIVAGVSASDADGDSVALTYTWYVNDVEVASGADATLDGAWFDRDDTVYVIVSADDASDASTTSSDAVVVGNTAPTAPTVSLSPVDATEGEDLTCAVVTPSTDADGDAPTYTFRWAVDGVAYTDATDGTTSSVVDGADVRAGAVWTCEVVANDGEAESDAATSGATDTVTITAACDDSASFTVASTSRSERETINAVAKDVDEDGYMDLLFANQLSSSVTIWWGGPSGVGAAETTLSMGRVGYGVDAGDLNGDGYPEVVASNQDYNQYTIAWGSGARSFSRTSTVSQSGFPQGVTLTDADRDGDLDLVSTLGSGWAGVSGGNCTITRINNGSGSFAASGCWTTDTNQKRAADLDGDGHDELIGSGTAVVYTSRSGSWTASGSVDLGSLGTSNQIYPYDADDDGDVDLVVADGTDSSLTTFRNDGTGAFTECDDTGRLSYWPYGVGDLDADGDLDYVSISTCGYCASTWRVGKMD